MIIYEYSRWLQLTVVVAIAYFSNVRKYIGKSQTNLNLSFGIHIRLQCRSDENVVRVRAEILTNKNLDRYL